MYGSANAAPYLGFCATVEVIKRVSERTNERVCVGNWIFLVYFGRLETAATNHPSPSVKQQKAAVFLLQCSESGFIVRWQWNKSLWHETIEKIHIYFCYIAMGQVRNQRNQAANAMHDGNCVRYTIWKHVRARVCGSHSIESSGCVCVLYNMLSRIFTLPNRSKHISSSICIMLSAHEMCWQTSKSNQISNGKTGYP